MAMIQNIWYAVVSIGLVVLPSMEPCHAQPVRRGAELTREQATNLLNRHLATPHVTMLEFVNGGIDRAEVDGVVQRLNVPAFPQWIFTPKGLQIVGSHLGQNIIASPLGGSGNPRFQLRVGLAQRVTAVTGIADGPFPSLRQIEYRTAYIFPTELLALEKYVFTGTHDAKADAQKFDDGWRIAR